MDGQTHGLVLAAGQSRRFGSGKLLASYHGRPLLSHVLQVVGAACRRGLLEAGHAVIAADDHQARALCKLAGLNAVLNDAPHLGLSQSVKLGLSAIESTIGAEPAAALILLGDQPLVRLEVIDALIGAWQNRPATIVRPRYLERPDSPGHPVLLDRSVWPLARRLEGDRGFADLLASPSFAAITLDVPGDNPDIDTREDLLALEESSS